MPLFAREKFDLSGLEGYYLYQMTQKPLILAVETSGRLGSVAIAAGPQLLAETAFSAPIRHSAEVFPAVSGLLSRFGREPKQIEQVYISAGPGSFTGLRIAVTLAKTMHLANNATKIVAVDTLDVIAANVANSTGIERIAAVLDAKRGQFFIAGYQSTTSHERRATSDGVWRKVFPDALMTADEFLDQFTGKAEPIWLLGEGLVYYKDKFKVPGVEFFDEKYWAPKAAKVHSLGWQKAQAEEFADPLTLTPNYLRKPV
jgi:tRNA threonylcarbamoyl adenosine modification protein YeaZ